MGGLLDAGADTGCCNYIPFSLGAAALASLACGGLVFHLHGNTSGESQEPHYY